MSETQRVKFLEAMAEAAKLIEFSQAALKRARAQCEGEIHEGVDLIFKRAFELRVKSDWLRYTVLGKIEDTQENGRQGSDRRIGFDRRIAGMQKKILTVS
jgi:hypothetical protein